MGRRLKGEKKIQHQNQAFASYSKSYRTIGICN